MSHLHLRGYVLQFHVNPPRKHHADFKAGQNCIGIRSVWGIGRYPECSRIGIWWRSWICGFLVNTRVRLLADFIRMKRKEDFCFITFKNNYLTPVKLQGVNSVFD